MAILKRNNGTYQARLQGVDGRILSKVFGTKAEAQAQEMRWKLQKGSGQLGSSLDRHRTLDDFSSEWFQDVSAELTPENQTGWRKGQQQLYKDFVGPILGRVKLHAITPQMVKRVLVEMAKLGKSEQTQKHVYNLLHKLFGDAMENYQYVSFNPVIRKLRPLVPVKEARHLNLSQIKKLLHHVDGKRYGLAIWIQLYLGLRIGELQALRWEDIDLEMARVSIRRTYVRKVGVFRDYPKGRRQHTQSIPPELLVRIRTAREQSKGDLVVASPQGNIIPYRWYLKALRDYCTELAIPMVSTHGLRHSTSELYLSHGASRDDLRQLFAHSSTAVTDRYIHYRGTSLEKVSNMIQLFPKSEVALTPTGSRNDGNGKSTTNRPRGTLRVAASGKEVS